MELVPDSEIFEEDTRNTKKKFLPTDAICIKCGVIFNSYWEDQCLICYDIEKDRKDVCDHMEFLVGKQSVDIRTLLDFHLEDLRAICDLNGLSIKSRAEMTYDILKKWNPSLDRRINYNLIRMIIRRNGKRFWYIRDIEKAISKVKKQVNIPIVNEDECLEIHTDVVDMKMLIKGKQKDWAKKG